MPDLASALVRIALNRLVALQPTCRASAAFMTELLRKLDQQE